MRRGPSSRIAVLLLDTLRKFEREPHTSRDDPAINSLERYVVRLVGELDALKSDEAQRPSEEEPAPLSQSAKIVEILRNTLVQVEQMSDTQPVIETLKSNLIRVVAELDAAASREALSSAEAPQAEISISAPAQPAGSTADNPGGKIELPPLLDQAQSAGEKGKRSTQSGVPREGLSPPAENGGNG